MNTVVLTYIKSNVGRFLGHLMRLSNSVKKAKEPFPIIGLLKAPKMLER